MPTTATGRDPMKKEITDVTAGYPWFQPVSHAALYAWTAFYLLFLLHAFRNTSGFLWIDTANLVVHEAGHPLFGYLGQTPGVWGGTLLELIVPAALCAAFVKQRQIPGTVFCGFFFFENFLYIATYMADARVQVLPLVTAGGDGGEPEHDWYRIFTDLGVLPHDTQIAAVVRAAGWIGMIGAIAWMWWIARRSAQVTSS